jgi:uncharacterized Zn-binding protein involved in type VI secretion
MMALPAHSPNAITPPLLLMMAFVLSAPIDAKGQNASSGTGTADPIFSGSPDVSVGGGSAARQRDATKDGVPVVQGSHDVFINGKPAATLGSRTACGGAVVAGAASVFVNGKPLARSGDQTQGCERR